MKNRKHLQVPEVIVLPLPVRIRLRLSLKLLRTIDARRGERQLGEFLVQDVAFHGRANALIALASGVGAEPAIGGAPASTGNASSARY